MEIELLALCTNAHRNKTLTLSSIFETVTASSVPLTMSALVVAAKVRLDASECRRKRFYVALTSPDASVTDLMLSYERLDKPPAHRATCSHLIVLPVSGLTLCCWGQYTLTLTVDSHEPASTCFYVQPAKSVQRPVPPVNAWDAVATRKKQLTQQPETSPMKQ